MKIGWTHKRGVSETGLSVKPFRRIYQLLYCERWVKAPVQLPEGTLRHNEGGGLQQEGVISPILANIFLDIGFGKWIEKNYPDIEFERYADDIVVHCRNIKQALRLLEAIKLRLTKWVRNKYWKFRRRHWYIAYKFLKGISRDNPNLFEHWKFGFLP